MSDLVFNAPKLKSLPIKGSDKKFPINRVYCVGRNYAEHAKEMGFTGREAPFFFLKPADAVVHATSDIEMQLPYPSLTNNLHYEVELVVAIGKNGKNISAADANEYIYGFAVGLDMTRRDLQLSMRDQGRPWDIGKGFDYSAPIGEITRIKEIDNIEKSKIWLDVNNVSRQASKISSLIWNIPEIIEHISAAWELKAGDLIMTGTPEGVGAVVPGDLISAGVDEVGSIVVRIV